MADQLPAARAAIADKQGLPTPEFYRFLLGLQRLSDGSASTADFAALQAQIAAIQSEIDSLPKNGGYPDLQVSAPILSQGLLKNGFAKLALNQPGDSGAGALKGIMLDEWGRVVGTTDATISGAAGRIAVADGDASTGAPTIDLATVADAGGGSLLKFARDAWGRITGTSTPTTTDLAEGSNLYFTATRVLATVLTGLSTATSAVITAADSVLSALGKLQSQISANVTALAGKLTAANNLSDVANATTARANLGINAGSSDLLVNMSTAQNIPASTLTTINFDTKVRDARSEFNTSTHEFTPISTGYYSVGLGVYVDNVSSSPFNAYVALLENGNQILRYEQIYPNYTAGLGITLGGSRVLKLTAGNNYSFAIYVLSRTLTIETFTYITNASIFRIT